MPSRPRRRFDDDDLTVHPAHRPIDRDPAVDDDRSDDEPDGPSLSTYHHPDTARGPAPVPAWVPTAGDAVDDDRGVLKSGKEADVSLLRRSAPGGAGAWLAVKRYRDAEHRMFHRDAGYLEGRRTRSSREARAMEKRTAFGKQLIAGRWAAAEFAILAELWTAGAAVPYPVQLLGTEVMMQFVGSPDGIAAPRLAQLRPSTDEADDLYRQLRGVLTRLADAGYAHGDLSAYNVLVDDGRLVLIDLPQAVDLLHNPRGFDYLRRDCANICDWFAARGVRADPVELEEELVEVATARRRRP